MKKRLSAKARWRAARDLEYIHIDARPANDDKSPASLEVEFTSALGTGACRAMQELIMAVATMRTPDAQRAFFERLREWAKAQRTAPADPEAVTR